MRHAIHCLALICLPWGFCSIISPSSNEEFAVQNRGVELGNFSVSLTVKDLKASQAFYEKLGFKQIAGDLKQNYLIMQNETSTIGLFQGMFEKNMLTFNPGWDRNSNPLEKFQDVRELQREFKKLGLEPIVSADDASDGPAFFMLTDPDGNPILIDQHVQKPAK
ncbi:MAG: VOC family protein [Pirellulaceae bacterium]|jgi:catechol 2,3-dioxygenase-like lactoylglutathione lyase family enzyme|nr:VOC family protein [Pirellulaceae bacterium]